MAHYNRIKPALYNEIDSYAAQWLRNLIAAGHIAPGDVDERSITDITPDDLRGYTQFHTFAGIGVWSYALRMAGWEDDRPVWTGSCPCQPFSSAGKGAGFDDERHLWPFWHHLIRVCRPGVVFGEQVASKDGLEWFDLVQSDLEGEGYAVGAQDRCSAGVGAPHIRQRLYFVATEALGVGQSEGFGGRPGLRGDGSAQFGRHLAGDGCGFERLADYRRLADERLCGPGEARGADRAFEGEAQQRQRGGPAFGSSGAPGELVDAPSDRREESRPDTRGGRSAASGRAQPELRHAIPIGRLAHDDDAERRADGPGGDFCDGPEAGRHEGPGYAGPGCGDGGLGHEFRPGPVNGPWRDADWLFCRDGKWRPVESGTFPLAHGAALRMGCMCAFCGAETVREGKVLALRHISPWNEGRGEEDLLRQGVLQAASSSATSDQQKLGTLSGQEGGDVEKLQSVRFDGQSSRSSPGPECFERSPGELGEDLRDLPPQGAHSRTAFIDVRCLPDDFYCEVTSEPEQDLFCPMCERVGTHFCEQEVGAGRVGKLRAYGNAIEGENARDFISTFIEAEAAGFDLALAADLEDDEVLI